MAQGQRLSLIRGPQSLFPGLDATSDFWVASPLSTLGDASNSDIVILSQDLRLSLRSWPHSFPEVETVADLGAVTLWPVLDAFFN